MSERFSHNRVAVIEAGARSYPEEPPFDPPEKFPEAPEAVWHLDPRNRVYPAVREALRRLGLDAAGFGSGEWNPLGAIIRPGDHVLIKPNMVRHFHGGGIGVESLITHGSVVRAVLDYAAIALKGRGRVTIGDSPLQYADFAMITRLNGVARVAAEVGAWAGVPVAVVDFRKERSEKREGLIVSRIPNDGDPAGYRTVDLGDRSRFAGMSDGRTARFRVTQYDPARMGQAHGGTRHAYLIPGSVLEADVVINVPKLKTHRKAGLTAAMKNLVGINGSKDWLPHHTAGAAADGGDEYHARSFRKRAVSVIRDRIEGRRSPSARRGLHLVERVIRASGRVVPFADPYWEGSWHGNDTVWRMVHDLHQVLYHADASGVIRREPQRRYLAIVDAVVAGEGDGPMRPSPRPAGLIVAGLNPAAVDLACCRLMGFDERKIPLLRNTLGAQDLPRVPSPEEIEIVSNDPKWEGLFGLPRSRTFAFAAPSGWEGAIELAG